MTTRRWQAFATGLMLTTAAMPLAAQQSAARCEAGWAGTVNYSRSQANSDAKTVQRVSGKGTESTNWSLKSEYNAQLAVRAMPGSELSAARADITLAAVSTETKTAQDRYICPHERAARSMSGSFVTKSETRGTASGLEADVDVTMDHDGRYGVSVRFPEFKGTVSGSDSSSFGGQCTAREGINRSLAETPATIDAQRFSSSGTDRVDPVNPDRIAGRHSVTQYGVTESLSWNLRRCGGALRLVELKFADMKFPTWKAWQDIVEQKGTTDGNIVRFTAVVANDGSEEKTATVKFRDTYKGDKYDGARRDGLLGEVSVRVPAGEQREVTYEWDSSGYAWYDDGRPRLTQRIRAEVEDAGKKVDETVRNLKVAPRPVLLVHGLWSNWKAWESWQNILTTSHSYDWKAYPVGERPQFGRMNTGEEVGNLGATNTIAQNADELGRYIKYAQRERNAWHVDVVAHSMGGLISRRYISAAMPMVEDGKPQVSHLVMLGTPNMGSRCADMMSAPLEFAGRSMDALRELRPSVVAQFNAANANRKGVEFSILAGNPLPAMCYMFDANDGVVTVPSATWTIADAEQQSVLHTDMTGVEGFASFVKPRLAIGPGGRTRAGATASFKPHTSEIDADVSAGAPGLSKLVKLAAGETATVAIPVEAASSFGMTFVAPAVVSATLLDDGEAMVGSSLAGSLEASRMFRSFTVDRPVTQGTWKLQLENTSRQEREVILAVWPKRI